MQGMAIDSGMHGHCGNAHFFTSAENSERNFPTVGNQNFGKAHSTRSALSSIKQRLISSSDS